MFGADRQGMDNKVLALKTYINSRPSIIIPILLPSSLSDVYILPPKASLLDAIRIGPTSVLDTDVQQPELLFQPLSKAATSRLFVNSVAFKGPVWRL